MNLRRRIRQAISEGVSAEETNAEITDRVMKVLDETEIDLSGYILESDGM